MEEMNLKQIIERLAALEVEVRDATDIEVVNKGIEEKTGLLARKAELEALEVRKQTAKDLNDGKIEGRKIDFMNPQEDKKMEVRYDSASKEYRNAFLKNLVGAEMTVEERAAFTHTTANTTDVLPTTMLNMIWDLVSKKHSIMGDIKIFRTGTILEVVKHTAIAAGAAAVTAQGVANANDEQNTFVKVTLSGKDFSKHVIISYAMKAMSIDALESYLISEISTNIGEALADDTIAVILAGTAAGNKINSAGVKVLTYKEVAAILGKLKNVSNRVVYVNNATFYNYIVSIEDTTGRPIFQPTMQDGAMGVILGAQIKIEESCADNVIYVGDPQMVVMNMVQDILIEQDKDVKTHTHVYAGYARAESALLNDTSFAVLTVKQA